MSFTEEGVFVDDDVRMVTLIDRTGIGGPIKKRKGEPIRGEFQYGARVYPITKEPFTVRFPIAKHIMRYGSQTYVHDREDNYVNRLGVKDATDPSVIDELGAGVLECGPIQVDTDMIEGWNVATKDPDPQSRSKRFRELAKPQMAELRGREDG